MTCFKRWLCCKHNYAKLVNKANSRVDKELDLKKFLIRQRIALHGLQGLLVGSQQEFIDKISEIIIHESTMDEATSSDDEHLYQSKTNKLDYLESMINSKSQINKRLLNVQKIKMLIKNG